MESDHIFLVNFLLQLAGEKAADVRIDLDLSLLLVGETLGLECHVWISSHFQQHFMLPFRTVGVEVKVLPVEVLFPNLLEIPPDFLLGSEPLIFVSGYW